MRFLSGQRFSACAAFFLCLNPLLCVSSADDTYKKKPSFYEHLPVAPKGGEFRSQIPSDPKVMNPVLSTDAYSSAVEEYLWMSLMTLDPENLDFLPALAESYRVSDDKKTYTFFLNPKARWQDGTPVTSADIKFTLDLINNPHTQAAALRSYYEGIEVRALDVHTVEFQIKTPQFDNLFTLSAFKPIQEKQFKNSPDFNQDRGIMAPVGNGPYIFEKFERGQKISLTRNKNWWAKDLPLYKSVYNIDRVNLEVIGDSNLAYERFLKEALDVFNFTPEQWASKVNKLDKDKFSTSASSEPQKKLWAFQESNKFPKPYSFIGWNAKNPIFEDADTRTALSYLVDYKKINEKVLYNLGEQSTSPFGSFTQNSNPELRMAPQMISYDRAKAVALLKKSGWENKGGRTLVKTINGKEVPFHFSLDVVNISPTMPKIAQILKEDLKVVGIQMDIRELEWNAFLGKLDQRDFDAVMLGWTSTLFPNARQIWHSESQQQGGSNFVGYQNSHVDALIEAANKEFDLKKRAKIMQTINTMIYHDQPYTFLFEPKFILQGINKRIHSPRWVAPYSGGTMNELFYVD